MTTIRSRPRELNETDKLHPSHICATASPPYYAMPSDAPVPLRRPTEGAGCGLAPGFPTTSGVKSPIKLQFKCKFYPQTHIYTPNAQLPPKWWGIPVLRLRQVRRPQAVGAPPPYRARWGRRCPGSAAARSRCSRSPLRPSTGDGCASKTPLLFG